MSSHLLSEVSDVCDEIAIIDHGKLIVYDTLSNVTAKVSGGENVVEIELRKTVDVELVNNIIAKLPYITNVEKSDGNTFRIKFAGGLDTQEKLLADLVKMKIGIVGYKPASSALEGAYLSLIKDTL
jgi:ABC-2 type transport system ATP-binding protein